MRRWFRMPLGLRSALVTALLSVLLVPAVVGRADAAIPVIEPVDTTSYLAPNSTVAVTSTGRPKVMLLGDSTMSALRWEAGSQANLAGLDFILDVESCRTISVQSCRGREGYRPPNAMEVIAKIPQGSVDELVLMVGYNESSATFTSSLQQVMPLIRSRGVKHVTWLTFHVEGTYQPPLDGDASYRSNNVLLRALANSSGGYVTLLDWDRLVDERNQQYVQADGAHISTVGAYTLAQFIRDAVVELWSSSPSEPVGALARKQQTNVAATGVSFLAQPQRVLDTREGIGVDGGGTVKGGEAVRVQPPNLPADATAVLLNITGVNPTGDAFITAYPCSATLPTASMLNLRAGTIRAAAAWVALDADLGFCLYSQQYQHLVADLIGVSTASSSNAPMPVPLRRILDTRQSDSALVAGKPRLVSVPVGSEVTGVTLNATITEPSAAGFLTMYPTNDQGACDAPPLASNLNYAADDTIANRADVRDYQTVGARGVRLCAREYRSGARSHGNGWRTRGRLARTGARASG